MQLVRRTVTGSMLAVLVVAAPGASARMQEPPEPRGGSADPAWVMDAERLMEKYGCSTTGLGPDRIPTRAVVRVRGNVRTASFDEGWAMHQGRKHGTLVAVCAR